MQGLVNSRPSNRERQSSTQRFHLESQRKSGNTNVVLEFSYCGDPTVSVSGFRSDHLVALDALFWRSVQPVPNCVSIS